MAVQQFTRCIEPERFEPRSRPKMAAMAAVFAGTFAAYALLTGHPLCALFAIQLWTCMLWILYCENWLYERLICIGGDVEAIGLVVKLDPPKFTGKFWDVDNDYCFNLLLQCAGAGVQEGDPELQNSPYGVLIENKPVILALGSKVPGYKNNGYMVPADPPNSATLHCELEGSVIHDYYLLMQALLGITVLAFAACMILPPWLSWISWLILAILLGLTFIGMYGSQFTHPGSPSDVNPDLPTIHKNEDVLYVQGTWVYDPLHDGYNEIHPVKVCCKIGCWNFNWANTNCDPDKGPTEYDKHCLPGGGTNGIILRLRNALEEARAELTIANQKLPEHQWRFHPDLDGCIREVIL